MKAIDIIDQQSYAVGHAAGYAEGQRTGYDIGYIACELNHRRTQQKKERMRAAKKECLIFFLKWKVVEIFLAVLVSLLIWMITGSRLITAVVTLASIIFIVKNKYWRDDYEQNRKGKTKRIQR
jgi:L-asparagine transporter-like permease